MWSESKSGKCRFQLRELRGCEVYSTMPGNPWLDGWLRNLFAVKPEIWMNPISTAGMKVDKAGFPKVACQKPEITHIRYRIMSDDEVGYVIFACSSG